MMELKQNIFELIGYQVIKVCFAVLQIAILADIFVFSDSTVFNTKQTFLLPNRILLLLSFGLCILAIIISFIKNKPLRYEPKKVSFFLLIASILLFIIQLTISLNTYFFSGWDAGGIRSSVFEIVNGTHNIWYDYSRFPGQINITFIMVCIVKFAVWLGIDGYVGILIVSALLVNLAGAFTFLNTYIITQRLKYAIFSWCIFVLLVGLSPWISIPYSDTFSILFPALTYYLYLSMKPEKNNWVRWGLIGLLSLFGYTIKPTAIIVLIAIVFLEFWKLITKVSKKKFFNFLFSLMMIALSVFPVYLINITSRNLLEIKLDKERQTTIFHLAMMGLNVEKDGAYSKQDVLFSMSFDTIQKRNAANIQIIKERLSDFGVIGYLKFLGRKILVNFSDGSFDWGGEGNFYQEIPERKSGFASLLQNIYYQDGKYNLQFLTIVQIIWFIVLILSCAMIFSNKTLQYKNTIIMIVIIGIVSVVLR